MRILFIILAAVSGLCSYYIGTLKHIHRNTEKTNGIIEWILFALAAVFFFVALLLTP